MSEAERLNWSSQGKQYSCKITIGAAQRLKENGLDLLDPEQMKVLFGNTLKVVEAIAELCRPQWEGSQSYTDFADVVIDSEETFADASRAFTAGLADFFRRCGRPAMGTVVDRAWAAATAQEAAAQRKVNGPELANLMQTAMDKWEDEFDQAVEKERAKILGGQSGD